MAEVNSLLLLQALAEARALLFELGDFNDIDEAVVPLLQYADERGIPEQTVEPIICAAFKIDKLAVYDPVRDVTGSFEEVYRAIRQRRAAGGPGWEPK